MADTATFELNQVEAARLDRALVQSLSIENRSAIETVKYLMIRIMQAGRSRTKQGKKFRDVKENPAWSKGSKESRYVIVKKLQPSGEVFLPKNDKGKANDPRCIILTRGLAKSSWGWGLKKMGESSNTIPKSGRFTFVLKKLSGINPFVLLKISLEYIDKVHPGIVQQAMASAVNYILKRQEQKLQKQLQRQFTR
jgi:hypothetical protein